MSNEASHILDRIAHVKERVSSTGDAGITCGSKFASKVLAERVLAHLNESFDLMKRAMIKLDLAEDLYWRCTDTCRECEEMAWFER